MSLLTPDVCIVGGGSAGLVVAAGAAQLGLDVVLIERALMGGDCLNYGCVPSKALIAAAKAAQAQRNGAIFGIAPVEPAVDFGKVMDHVAGVIAAIAPNDSVERFEKLGVRVLQEEARFTGRTELQAGSHRIRSKRIVLATGSRPSLPPLPGLADAPHFTNETLFANRVLPSHLVVLGGGPIGLEMAQAFRRLGARVTVLEASTCLAKDDPELAAIVVALLRREGVQLHEKMKVARIERTAGGIAAVLEDGRRIEGSHLLIATGRVPTVDGLDLDKAGVAHDRRGITVGDELDTGAIGTRSPAQHIAAEHGACLRDDGNGGRLRQLFPDRAGHGQAVGDHDVLEHPEHAIRRRDDSARRHSHQRRAREHVAEVDRHHGGGEGGLSVPLCMGLRLS